MKKVSLIFGAVSFLTIVLTGFTKATKEVTIGNQVWMAENLNVDKFRNGDLIPEAKTDDEWVKAGLKKQPAWCYYNNDAANGEKYVKLYNWYAVKDPRGLAPTGWHIPNDAEWTQLSNYLGGEYAAGTKMKSTSGWNENGNGTNKSGFSGLAGGFRDHLGTFAGISKFGFWWSTTESTATYAWARYLGFNNGNLYRKDGSREDGFSVRCLKD